MVILLGNWRLFAVAPLAGAWIEIGVTPKSSRNWSSRLLQARGLKYQNIFSESCRLRSRLLQARGLKCPLGNPALPALSVAPLAGAWIEICRITESLSA